MMNIGDLLQCGDEILGREVQLDGCFVLVGQEGYFVRSMEERDVRRSALKLDVHDLKKIVMARVPPSGGSKYYYLDAAIVCGRLENGVEGYAYTLRDVTVLKIEKSGEWFVAIP